MSLGDLACKDLGIALKTTKWDGKGSPKDYVVSANLHRRHLNASQRAMIAAKLHPHYAEKAKERQMSGKSADESGGGRGQKKTLSSGDDKVCKPPWRGRASNEAGKALNVSAASVDRARIVQEQGSGALKKAVEKGEVSVTVAAAVAPKVSKRKQTELVKMKQVEQEATRLSATTAMQFAMMAISQLTQEHP